MGEGAIGWDFCDVSEWMLRGRCLKGSRDSKKAKVMVVSEREFLGDDCFDGRGSLINGGARATLWCGGETFCT